MHPPVEISPRGHPPLKNRRHILLPNPPRPTCRRPHLRLPQRHPPHRRHRLPYRRLGPKHQRARRNDRTLHLPLRGRGRSAHEREAGGALWEYGCVSLL